MKRFLLTSILFATLPLTLTSQAQTGPTGTWRAESPTPGMPWTVVLRADGPRVYGAATSCASVGGAVEIFDGRIDGNAITFKCMSGNRERTVTLTGRINGDNIDFTWDIQGPGASPNQMFGTLAPWRFTATRVPDGANAVTEKADRAVRKDVSFERILHADQEPQNWLTYSGTLSGRRYSPLIQITPVNVNNLELAWIWQTQPTEQFETTSLVVDGVLYTVQADNDAFALDAHTGRELWKHSYTPARESGRFFPTNRGLAILGDTLFMGTGDAHLLAINAFTGKLIWNTTVPNAADPTCEEGRRICYSITHAPLVVKDKVIVGVGGGDAPIRGFIAAFDAATGKQVWRFNTIPAPGEPGNETWSGDSWKTGGVGVWNTGTYDPDLNLTYWGTGNPYPVDDGDVRRGDNLYSDSVVALDADTGKLRWHYQFTPHDVMDWDAAQVPVLTDIEWQGRPRKVLLQATKNGLMYVLDRMTGQFLMGKPFVQVNWMSGFDEKGRPLAVTGKLDGPEKTIILPAIEGTNWWPPSYSPTTGLFYISSWERGGPFQMNSPGYGAMRAFDPQTGEMKWEFKKDDAVFSAGALTTASGLLFTGTWGDFYSGNDAAALADRYFYALDARTGQLLWKMSLTGRVYSAPMSYAVDGKQYIAVAAGNTLWAFALRQ